jgi:heat-inducible transcriptional repressor
MSTSSESEAHPPESGEERALDERKAVILRKVVAEHIDTGQPVGSAHVVRDPNIGVSPATVRSDMATLEREGYLTHPHTSAGRVPTDKGYRFFVDHLETSELDPAGEIRVSEFFARAHGELERRLRDTSQLLSEITDHAAVVVAPAHVHLDVRSVLLTRLGPTVALLVVVLSNGIVDKHPVEIAELTGEATIETAQSELRDLLVGHSLSQVTAAGPIHSGDGEADVLIAACLYVLEAQRAPIPEGEEVYVGGTAKMAEQFAALEQVREVLSILEQSFVVVSLIRDVLSTGEQVSIGAEHHLEPLAECSLVVAPYMIDNETVGTIAVLGPTRMNYAQALAAVAGVSRRLGNELSGG